MKVQQLQTLKRGVSDVLHLNARDTRWSGGMVSSFIDLVLGLIRFVQCLNDYKCISDSSVEFRHGRASSGPRTIDSHHPGIAGVQDVRVVLERIDARLRRLGILP